jgi:uncharacterized membrane protein YgaE (UPF0421/DUF939 family)
MIEKVNLRQVLAIVGIGLAMCFMFSMFSKPSTNIDKLQSNTDRNLGRIKAESSSVGVEIDRSQTASANAIEAIKRTELEVRGSREAVGNLNAGIAKLQAILGECEELARKNSNIIERIDGAN